MSARERPCDANTRAGRLRKAMQFFDQACVIKDLADDDDNVSDAYVSLCVLAGIAAADVICCTRLGRYAQGEDHRQSLDLLQQASAEAAPRLVRLLAVKSKAAYTSTPASRADARAADVPRENLWSWLVTQPPNSWKSILSGMSRTLPASPLILSELLCAAWNGAARLEYIAGGAGGCACPSARRPRSIERGC